MKHSIKTSMLALALFSATPAIAQDSDQSADPIEQDAMAALDRMGAALRQRTEFVVTADLTAEDVLVSGQKLQFGGTLEIAARRPSNLRLLLNMGPSERQLYYDGSSITLYAPDKQVFATAKAPATIRDMLAAAEDEYGLYIPLTDLFRWGTDTDLTANISFAFSAGSEKIGDLMCDHYALRQPGVDWQVWIRQGDDALPCKLVITSTDDPSMPQVTATYHWDMTAIPEEASFHFSPPADAMKIEFEPLGGATANSGE